MKLTKDTVFGWAPSKIDGTEHEFSTIEVTLPEEYSYREYLPKVINQGELSICVPCSLSAFLNWNENLKDGSRKDNGIDLMDIYNHRPNNTNGMTFKDALRYLRHNGVDSKNGKLKIGAYAMIKKVRDLQYALLLNGPCIAALPVWSDNTEFWNQEYATNFYGYHAISVVGYNHEGFIIRNSWGKSYGDNGYAVIPYKNADEFLEIWTIIQA